MKLILKINKQMKKQSSCFLFLIKVLIAQIQVIQAKKIEQNCRVSVKLSYNRCNSFFSSGLIIFSTFKTSYVM
jgi:hypothetical protein